MSFLLDELKRIDPETYMGCMEGKIEEYQRIIDEQARQIAELKTALIDRDIRLLEPCNGECGKNDIQPEDCDRCEHDYVMQALAREMPQFDWEDMK